MLSSTEVGSPEGQLGELFRVILGDLDFIIHQGFPSAPARLPSWHPRLVGIISAHIPQQTACPDLTCMLSSSNHFLVLGTGSHPSHLPWYPKSPAVCHLPACLLCVSCCSIRNWLIATALLDTHPVPCFILYGRLSLVLCLLPHAHRMAATGPGILALK